MKKIVFVGIIGILALGLAGCGIEQPTEIADPVDTVETAVEQLAEVATPVGEIEIYLTPDEKVTYTPSEEDWCDDDCIIYPENGRMYIKHAERDVYVPEGTDFFFGGPSEDEKAMIIEWIREDQEKITN
ncbi:hypothetical protein KKD70_01900 [Patescibacteria group bacterium]|nr:hypothetical protein [Patescibacteria group bacterium]